MPLITVDTSVALPATLSPSGLARKLWVVLAFGAVAHRAEHLRLDREALLEAPQAESGELHGADALDALVERAEQHRAALVELLPAETPSGSVERSARPANRVPDGRLIVRSRAFREPAGRHPRSARVTGVCRAPAVRYTPPR